MKKSNLILIFLLVCTNVFSQYKFDKVLYGVAYYYEYAAKVLAYYDHPY